MSENRFSANIEGKLYTDKPLLRPDNRPDFARMEGEAKGYAERILATLQGEKREEVAIFLDSAITDIHHADIMSRRVGHSLVEEVEDAERSLDEIIGDLKADYGIEDTEALDNIQQELRTWLNERRLPPGQARRL